MIPALEKIENLRIIDPDMAVEIGINESLFVTQLYHWMKYGTERDGHKWVYRTHDEWLTRDAHPYWSKSTLRRVITNLEDLGIVLSAEMNKMKQDRTKWYTLNPAHDLFIVSSPSVQVEQVQVSNVDSSNHNNTNNNINNQTPAASASEVAEEFIQAIDPEEEVTLLEERPLHGPTCSRFWRVMQKAGGLTKGMLPEHNKAEQGQLRKLMQKLGPSGPKQLSYALLNYGAFTIYAKEHHDFKLPAKPNIIKMTALAEAILEFEPPIDLPESEYQLKTVAELLEGGG